MRRLTTRLQHAPFLPRILRGVLLPAASAAALLAFCGGIALANPTATYAIPFGSRAPSLSRTPTAHAAPGRRAARACRRARPPPTPRSTR